MRVLVTGNQGYIGSVFVPMLQGEGHEAVGLDSGLYRNCVFGLYCPSIRTLHKDVRDITLSDLYGFDAVVHLAALSNDPLGDLRPDITYDINYRASVRLAKLSREAGVRRFVFSSSCSNYGAAGDDFVDENAVLAPVTPYSISKVRVEEEVEKLADDSFSPIFLRNATAYGLSPFHRFDIVLNNLVAWASTTGLVHLKSDGKPWRPIVHVEDISRAILAVLLAPRHLIHNQIYNVGSTAENYRISELAQIVRQTVPGSTIEFSNEAGPDVRCYRVNFSKFETTFPDYLPKWNATWGAEQLYLAYRELGLGLSEFEGPKYKRVEHLKLLLRQNLLDDDLRWTARTSVQPWTVEKEVSYA